MRAVARAVVLPISFILIVALIGILATVVSDAPQPQAAVELSHLDNICWHLGMTENELRALVGVPPGDYRTRPTEYGSCGCAHDPSIGESDYFSAEAWRWKCLEWQCNSTYLACRFRDGKLVTVSIGEGRRAPSSIERAIRDAIFRVRHLQ